MLEKLLIKIATLLNKHGIPYMIIGGQAAIIYREPRFTNDIDISLGVDSESLNNVMEFVNEANLRVLPDNIKEFVEQTGVLPCIDDELGIRTDFIFSNTDYERHAIRRAREININDNKVHYCSLEDMIILKVFAGRPRDIEDVTQILLKNSSPDNNYIIENLKQLGTAVDIDLVSIYEGILVKSQKI